MRNFIKFTLIFFVTFCAKAQVPTATILGASSVNCSDGILFFAAKVTKAPGTILSYKWSVPVNRSGRIVSGDSDSSATISFSLPGVYTFSVTVSDGTLSSSAGKVITVTRSAKASFNASLTTTGYPNQLSLMDYSTYNLKSYWIYSGSAMKDSAVHVLKDYPGSGSYTVTLKALGKSGCNDSLSYAFRISDSSGVTLPNIFSPNDDGINDVYAPITKGISKLNAWIYNRWGILMTSWDRVNGEWYGHNDSGIICAPGEYFIFVEATGFDGNSFKQKGTITLVR